MKQSFWMRRKENPQKLDNDKNIDEVTILLFLQMFFPHEMHELSDELGNQQVEWRRDDCNDDGQNDFCEEGKNQIFEEVILLLGMIQSFDAFE